MENKSKIAVAMIVKDDTEASILHRCLRTLAPHVDGIFITGTKEPQEKVKEVCKEFNAVWSWFPWIKDFSAARNFNFAQVPQEYRWIFWCDTDDVVVGADKFREAVALAEANNYKAIFARYLYQVELDEQNNVKNILIEHLRERLIRNDGTYKWVAPIHETLIEQVPSGKTDYGGFVVIHLITAEEMVSSMWRNIEILEDEVIRNSEDPRPIYYLAKAYFDTKEPMLLYESIGPGLGSLTQELIKDYISKSGWSEERSQAYEYLSMIYREQGKIKESIDCLLEAEKEEPKFLSIYVQLALSYVMLKDWEKAMHWIRVASAVPVPKTTLVVNPRDYKTMILEALFHIYLNTGKLEECLKVATELNNILPSDISRQRVQEIEDVKRRNDVAHWVVKLAMHLNQTGQKEELEKLVDAIPREIASEPVLVNLRNEFSPIREWKEDEIVIYCGPGFEQWSPKSVAKGIGGSEEAVIYLTRELAKLGWKVTVYADPREDEGYFDGVLYLPYYKINWKDHFNILVSWRQIGLFDVSITAKKTYLWNHDIQNPLTYTKERVNKITKAMFLSKWHRANVPELDESKVMYSANGVVI